jgi:class 3 adenylate cyclase/tetratricopeptide (TPR) repeat protein
MKDNNIIQKIKELTSGFKGKDEPSARLTWLKDLVNSYKRYLPPRVVEKIILDPSAKKIEGERRIITVAFADLSGFTALSETMDPEDIANIINDFFTRMLKIVFKYEGSVDKFLGDALMVLFGAPIAHHDDPERAVRAALEMQQEMLKFNDEKKFSSPLAMSIGINTGPAVALNVGSEQKMEYTVIGDAVNLAARLEGVSKAGEIIISHNTYQQIADIIEVEKKPSVKVKGKKKPVLNYLVKEMREHYKLPDVSKLKIVGRQHERQVIESCLEKVEVNQTTILGIVGEPGTGKTRLGLEAVFLARKKNFAVLNARCMPYESNIAYTTIISLFTDYFKIRNESNEHDKKLLISLKLKKLGLVLDETLPYIGALYGLKFPQIEQIPPDELKKRIFDSIKEVFSGEARKSPLLIRVEDVQWSDPTSNELLDSLFNHSDEIPILFLFEYRSDFAFPWLSHKSYKNIALKSFSKEETLKYSQEILDTLSINQEILDTVYRKSSGNPLFIQEILKFLIRKGGVRKKKGQAVVSNRFKTLEIAESMSGVILAQIDRMSESDRHLLQYASVVGKTFRPALLSKITNISTDDLKETLERLVHFEGILVLQPDIDETIYEFISPTTYEVIYGSLFKTRRKELHLQIGGALEKQFAKQLFENSEQLAHHFVNSTDKAKGVTYAKLAADKSYRLYALKESLNFFQQALNLLGKKDLVPKQLQDKLEVLRRQGLVLRILGNLDQAIMNQKRSLRIARKLDSPQNEAGAYLNIGIIYQEMGVPQKGVNYWTRARRIAKNIGNKQIQALAVNNLGNYYLHTGDLDKAIGHFHDVANLSKEIDDERGLALANLNLGATAERKGDLQKALEYYSKAYVLFDRLGEKENIARCLNQVGITNLLIGNIETALKKLSDAEDLASKIGDKITESNAKGNIGLCYAQLWQLDKAYDKFSEALTIAQMIGDPAQQVNMNINLGDIHLYRGNLTHALGFHKKAAKLSQEHQDPFNEALVRRSLGWDYFYLGNYMKAQTELTNSQELFNKIGDRRNSVISLIGIAATRNSLGFFEDTENILTDIESKARAMKDLEILALALDVKSDLLIFRNESDQARDVLEQLPDICRKIGNKRLHAWTIAKIASVSYENEMYDEAKEYIKKSLALAREIGDATLATFTTITRAKIAIAEDDLTNGLNLLAKNTEQARKSGTKEYLAVNLHLIAHIFKTIGQEQEYQKNLSEYGKVVDSITENLLDPDKEIYLRRLELKLQKP